MLKGRPEHAFTLIEMVVAMAIGLIVLGVFIATIGQAWTRSADSDSHSIASARMTDALDRLGDDLRSARIPARADIFQTATKDELRVQLGANPVLYGDVGAASGRQVSVYTNGDGAAAPVCVTWSYQSVDDGRTGAVWALTRRIDADCTPGPTEGREIIATLRQGDSPSVNTFRYGLLGTPNSLGVCPINVVSPGAGTLNADQRLRIVSVHVDLATAAARVKTTDRRRAGRDVLGLWARQNNDYYFALGCAQ